MLFHFLSMQIADVHEHSETFDKHTEFSFKYLQVFTACCNMFAHGSNDVANGVGPLAAIYSIWQTSTVTSKSPVSLLCRSGDNNLCWTGCIF
jgi:sodium-dependent phosphate transporter